MPFDPPRYWGREAEFQFWPLGGSPIPWKQSVLDRASARIFILPRKLRIKGNGFLLTQLVKFLDQQGNWQGSHQPPLNQRLEDSEFVREQPWLRRDKAALEERTASSFSRFMCSQVIMDSWTCRPISVLIVAPPNHPGWDLSTTEETVVTSA